MVHCNLYLFLYIISYRVNFYKGWGVLGSSAQRTDMQPETMAFGIKIWQCNGSEIIFFILGEILLELQYLDREVEQRAFK